MPADTISATMAITMINVLVGIMPESVLRPVPFFPNVDSTPKYLEDTTVRVTSENFYWVYK